MRRSRLIIQPSFASEHAGQRERGAEGERERGREAEVTAVAIRYHKLSLNLCSGRCIQITGGGHDFEHNFWRFLTKQSPSKVFFTGCENFWLNCSAAVCALATRRTISPGHSRNLGKTLFTNSVHLKIPPDRLEHPVREQTGPNPPFFLSTSVKILAAPTPTPPPRRPPVVVVANGNLGSNHRGHVI